MAVMSKVEQQQEQEENYVEKSWKAFWEMRFGRKEQADNSEAA